ncbi:putative circularly permuted ATP-grasp superfamily protein [Novosphingobium sp. PhB165]|uniref:circularly permuted type 2 ATP-grasp protein n=1 Tax=Novosphingobium sp. PhB165 TaxID=2485105 RepID=UPI0010530B76|nr:circularly permuted type 2 ATP-grasp protein [Novosphingobium sp. PhB165]TCM18052.1 putative circularly permuted ATP-grasp superfamily protein [Novosphingobium sp. PhB165]
MAAAPPSGPDSTLTESAPGWLDSYPVEVSGGDLFGDAAEPVAARWKAVAAGLSALSEGDPVALQENAARNAADLGLTFRVTGEEEERAWPLNAMPVVIGAGEWEVIERGLIQRAELLEHLAADIYGPQRMVREGHLPAAAIAGNPFFARKMLGRAGRLGEGPGKARFIQVYSADLARGPRGQWRVLQDRVRIANGIGYALENRLAMTRLAGHLLADQQVRRIVDFFGLMREGMIAACGREAPRVALLTPGRFNQTYAEQAHLARYLGFPLVEGRDLSVVDDRLWVGTIAGPKRVDSIWRWINTTSLDPLAFDARSQLGVANLFEAWAGGGVGMINWPGTEVLESPAFAAFMPRLCQVLLGEAPILPNIATWWCGQAAESATVAARLDELAVLPAFGQPVEGLERREPVAGADLDGAQRSALLDALARRPMDYCGQEIVHLSTVPAIIDGEIVPRPFTVRAFVARDADGVWTVMPGGFARLAASQALPTSLMGEGEISADVWVVDEVPNPAQLAGRAIPEPPISRGGGILASQAADNLYWFGRYNERAQLVTRVLRALLDGSVEIDGAPEEQGGVVGALVALLVEAGSIEQPTGTPDVQAIAAAVLAEAGLPGGVTTLMRRRQAVGLSLRERFARDFWRLVSQGVPQVDVHRPATLLGAVRRLTEHFSALAGLVSENMVRSAAWRFLEIGQRLERAQGICRMVRQLGDTVAEGADPKETGGALGVLLDLCDSQIIYRTRYLTGPMAGPVRDLVLLDPDNPRALVFQIAGIVEHLAALPSGRDDNLPEPPMRAARALLGRLQAATAQDMTGEMLERIEHELYDLSDALSARYFLQFDPEQAERRTLLL